MNVQITQKCGHKVELTIEVGRTPREAAQTNRYIAQYMNWNCVSCS